MGYDRCSSKAAFAQLQKVHRLVGLYGNFFQPVMKLRGKTRHGARVHKVYDTATTPYQRLLQSGVLTGREQDALIRTYRTLDPVRLKAQLDRALETLWTLADRHQESDPPVTVSSEATYAAR